MSGPDPDDTGQATVEFALVVPLVAVLLVGIVQLARVTALQVAVIDAARVEARAAAVQPDLAETGVGLQSTDDGEIETTLSGSDPQLVTVTVTRSVRVLPLVGWTSVDLEASSTMAVEQAD